MRLVEHELREGATSVSQLGLSRAMPLRAHSATRSSGQRGWHPSATDPSLQKVSQSRIKTKFESRCWGRH